MQEPSAISTEYVPAGHALQLDDKITTCPAGHFEHEFEPGEENNPTEQKMHAASPLAPIKVENIPALHSRQLTDPGVLEYFPEGHSLHIELPTYSPYCPTGQTKVG